MSNMNFPDVGAEIFTHGVRVFLRGLKDMNGSSAAGGVRVCLRSLTQRPRKRITQPTCSRTCPWFSGVDDCFRDAGVFCP